MDFKLGERRSFDGNLCTIRYVGEVAGTSGQWLGVEWDDPTRGKHPGEHKGVRYFTCKSNQPTAGSFVRPSRPADRPRGFLDALREKYASEFENKLASSGGALHSSIEISGKVVEEVGFDKIRKQLAELQELKIVLLDGLCVAGVLGDGDLEEREKTKARIGETCPKIVELDLSRNLISRWVDVADICDQLKRLRLLKLNGNRFDAVSNELRFEGVTELHLDETLLSWDEPTKSRASFTARKLHRHNLHTRFSRQPYPTLKHRQIRRPIRQQNQLMVIINYIPLVFPGLQSLRISGNPIYNQPAAPTTITNLPEQPMTVDEAYMLTLARLSSLQILNYGKITPQDRQNGELYYFSLIAKELSAYPESAEREILQKHPRYAEFCQKYGDPVISRAPDSTKQSSIVNPRSVAARLVKMNFYLQSQSALSSGNSEGTRELTKVKEIPRSFDTYQVKSIVARLFGLPPFQFRLIWETDELDPVSQRSIDDGDDWDSSEDEEMEEQTNNQSSTAGDDAGFVKREVELVESTRDIGVWFYGDIAEVKVRVELL
ncbi:hypothetical protein PHISCL_07678 [Aspergillus sclerotialis]|uniref:CAP-Gly domain-containing protein n=1 Tax=Aspergillus sclerotialis TaxID=2070753 RepID=A0A3A2ZBJ3_9EURO|nr:hypothetical protein PHISCL_07678 [Aspergillus sclerotialis]